MAEKLFVAKSADASGQYTRGLQEGVVRSINSAVLPFLREIGVNITGNINDYVGLYEADYYRMFYTARIARCKDEFEKEEARLNMAEAWRAFLKTHDVPTARIRINDETLAYVSYNDQTGVFDLDMERYEAQSNIYATTKEERETLKRLNAFIEAMNALYMNAYDVRLFVDCHDGKTTLKEEIYPGAWRDLVKRTSKKM